MKRRLVIGGVVALFALPFVPSAWTVLTAGPEQQLPPTVTTPTAVPTVGLVGLDGSDTVSIMPTRDDWDNAAKLQVESGPVRAGAYAMSHGAYPVPIGTQVHVIARTIGEYGILAAQIRLPDGRIGWINRQSLPSEAR